MNPAALSGTAALAALILAVTPQAAFEDRTELAGLDFVHATGAGGERFMVETMGSGLAVADLDGDGRLDAYFAQGIATPGAPEVADDGNALYRSGIDGRFERVPEAAPARDWSMGVAAADYDGDGFTDLFVSNLGPDQLFRNNGDGTWSDVTTGAGVDNPDWGASAAWADIDNDGDLDLYVTNYVDFSWENHKFCGNPQRNMRAYCHPDVYNAVADRLFRNDGDGTFAEIGAEAGIADTLDGKGLGVVFADYDDDGDADLYVANDSTRNFLYRNDGTGHFTEDGLLAGVAFSNDGQAEAGMGTDWGDYDGDGLLDVFVTNLDLETNSLYRNLGGGAFEELALAAGIGEPSLLQVGFGANWADFDNDSDLDLFVANGHIIDNIADFRDNITYAQRNQLFLNEGGRFTDVGPVGGLNRPGVSRGSAVADFDGDGRMDVLVSNNGERAELLRNTLPGAGGWLRLHLRGRRANRDGVGARVVATLSDGSRLVRETRTGSSYCSSSPALVHLGLGARDVSAVEIRWPGGGREVVEAIGRNGDVLIVEGRGVVAQRGGS